MVTVIFRFDCIHVPATELKKKADNVIMQAFCSRPPVNINLLAFYVRNYKITDLLRALSLVDSCV